MSRKWIVTLSLLLLVSTAAAQDCLLYDDFIRSVGSLPTNLGPEQLLRDGDLLYVGTAGGTLYVIDVSTPAEPVLLGEVSEVMLGTWSLAADGDYVYMGVGDQYPGNMSKIQVIDVSTPSSPVIVSAAGTGDWPRGIEIAGDLLLAACDGAGLRIFTLAYPGALVQIGHSWIPGESIGVAVHGDHAYVTNSDPANGIYIFDIGDPAAPVVLGSLITPQQCFQCAVDGDHLYVAAGLDGVRVYSLANPELPTPVAQLSLDSMATYSIEIDGNELIATGAYHGLYAIDISTPTVPELLVYFDTGYQSFDAASDGDYCYLPETAYGVHVVDMNPAAYPEVLATAPTQWETLDIARAGGLAYVMTSDGLLVLDVGAPGVYTQLAALPIPNYDSANVVLDGDFAYVSTYHWGIDIGTTRVTVVDVSDPANPVVRGVSSSFGSYASNDIQYTNGYVIVSHRIIMDSLRIIDVSNPDNPLIAGGTSEVISESPMGMVVSGDLLFVSDFYHGLVIFDISSPATPVALADYYLAAGARDIRLDGDIAYLATGDMGLLLLDVSDPLNPSLISTEDSVPSLFDLHMNREYIYAGNGSDMIVFEVQDPANPTLIGVLPDVPDGIVDLVGFENYLLAASGAASLNYIAYHCDNLTALPGTPKVPSENLAAWPNPFNPHTTLSFCLAAAGSISLDIYDVGGRHVRHLAEGPYQAGSHSLVWRGLGDSGRPVASGVYFARLSAEDGAVIGGKLVLIR